MEIMFIVFGRDISLVLLTRQISLHKNNSHDLHRVITHSLVLVIIFRTSHYLFVTVHCHPYYVLTALCYT